MGIVSLWWERRGGGSGAKVAREYFGFPRMRYTFHFRQKNCSSILNTRKSCRMVAIMLFCRTPRIITCFCHSQPSLYGVGPAAKALWTTHKCLRRSPSSSSNASSRTTRSSSLATGDCCCCRCRCRCCWLGEVSVPTRPSVGSFACAACCRCCLPRFLVLLPASRCVLRCTMGCQGVSLSWIVASTTAWPVVDWRNRCCALIGRGGPWAWDTKQWSPYA